MGNGFEELEGTVCFVKKRETIYICNLVQSVTDLVPFCATITWRTQWKCSMFPRTQKLSFKASGVKKWMLFLKHFSSPWADKKKVWILDIRRTAVIDWGIKRNVQWKRGSTKLGKNQHAKENCRMAEPEMANAEVVMCTLSRPTSKC